jgi:bacteriophage exclusion system BrxC/D-like protein
VSDLELAAADWLDALEREYLATFVRDGGAAVKVAVVPTPVDSAALAQRLMLRARELGFVAAQVDAAGCKVHLVHNFFCEVAKQIDWDHVVREFVRSALRGEGFELPEDGCLDVESLARANDQDVAIVKQAVRSMLTVRLMRDYGLGRQFRLGTLALCQALVEPDDVRRELADHARAWFRGELPRVGALRQAFIYQKIDRHTARTMVLSTSAFIRKAGWQGLVVVTDVSRYALARPIDDDFNRYSKSAALDMWETLRQFVDGTDDMDGCLLVFVTGREFLDDDQRGMRGYNALHLRLTDDVRDRRRPNPLAPMVRLAVVDGC